VPPATAAARFIGGAFGIAFAGIGIAVISALWFGDGMGDPPIIFKFVGSCIALVFVAMGGTMAYSAITGRGMMAARPQQQDVTASTSSPPTTTASAGYTCPHCGAGLARDADVSPMGDVKCAFCGRWYNVHGRN
jgi:hypothetical protein